jgi:uncharacterized protein (DUF58 family)
MKGFREWREEVRVAWTQGRQQLTRAWLIFTAILLVVSIAAFIFSNNLLFLIVAAMFSTLLISGFVSRLGLAGLELDLVLPDHISARRKVRAAIRVRNLKSWIPSFSIHLAGAAESGFDSILYFPSIPGGATIEESVDLYFPRRGAQRQRNFQFSTRFPFGFIERREMVTTRHEILIYPCLDPQPGFEALFDTVQGEIEAMQRGRGSDFYRIRPYEALESSRHVDWKATAHTGELQVREFAREHDWRVLINLDLDTPLGADAWFESAVECCAFLVFRLADRGIRVRFHTQEFDVAVPEEGNVHSVLKYLALVSPRHGKPLDPVDDPSSFQMVFTARAKTQDSATRRGARTVGMDAF